MNAAGYAKTLRQLAREVPSRMAREGADALTAELQSGFDAGTDPYGAGWAAKKDGSQSHLTDTGAMRAGTRAVPAGGAGINFESPPPANFHQSGTSRMPARRVLPDNGLPAKWRVILQSIYSRVMSAAGGR